MPLKKLMLPHAFQVAGWFMSFTGVIFTYLRFGLGIKPEWLKFNVFAIYSTYFDSKYFQVIENNISEEICGIVLLTGLFFLAFSKERNEKEHFWNYRLKALMISLYASTLFLLLSFLFFYGLAFMSVLTVYMVLPLIIYIIIFRLLLYRDRQIRMN
jgi:glycerol uptake facilitator-like aquaporin